MEVLPLKTNDLAVQDTLSLIQDVLSSAPADNIAIRLWDGTTWKPKPSEPTRCTLALQHPGALRKMFMPPSYMSLAEAYIYNDFDIEGEIEVLMPLVGHFVRGHMGILEQLRYDQRLLHLPETGQSRADDVSAKMSGALHSKERDQQAISYHYNRSNDFFALWLDSRMIYSCGYFASPDEDLDTAQTRKLDYLCRKLRLRPGERLLDIGCGWGGLIMYAAQHYGVEAIGITLSTEQTKMAHERIKQAGLEKTCHVETRDYRDIAKSEEYDKIVSVGMFEHVGRDLLPIYFQSAWKQLRPGGVFLNHGIGLHTKTRTAGLEFLQRYIFPDGRVVPIDVTLRAAAEGTNFQVRDVENLGEHYIYTIAHWLHRYEERSEEVKREVGETTYRIWRLYLALVLQEFQAGAIHLYQTLLVKCDTGKSGLPLMREDWYSEPLRTTV